MSDAQGKIVWREQDVPTLFWPTKLTRSLRLKFFLTGVIYPLICFGFNSIQGPPSLGTPWQSGDFPVYALELLSPPAFYCLLPIVGVSMLCISWWCLFPGSFNNILIRTGIYSGAIYSTVMTVLLVSATSFFGLFFAAILMSVQSLMIWILGNVIKKVYRFTILHLIILTTVIAILVSLGIKLEWDIDGLFFAVILFVVGGASTMACITFCRVSRAVSHLQHKSGAETNWSKKVAAFTAWVTASIFTWRLAIIMMLEQYSLLPVEPPDNCFVSNAAAYGHPILVGSKIGSDGNRRNLQMARVKFLEFVLQVTSPAMHRICRRIYNRIGPPMARFFRSNVWLASLAYLIMIPLALIAFLLQKSLSIPNAKVHQLYKL